MKKILAVCLLAGVLAAAGCSADASEGITERPGEEMTAASEAYDASLPDPEASRALTAEAPTAEQSWQEPTEETREAPADPVRLVEALGSGFLGLPDSGKVYIFRDRKQTTEISGEEYHGVSCYDDSEGELRFICDFWINSDGSRAYRQYGTEYRLLPETQEYSGFDPETQPVEDIFAKSDKLYEAVFGELSYDPQGVYLPSELGNFYPVTDSALDTRGKLNAALERYFTGELLDRLTEGTDKVISDDGGSLYVLEHSGQDIAYLCTEHTLTYIGEDRAEFAGVSRFEYEAGHVTEKSFTCTAVKTANGWRFSRYVLYRSAGEP